MNTTLTAIRGIVVGHAGRAETVTGCTVVLLPAGTSCGVDVRGGGPGTRETDLLDPSANVQHVDAICLCGGSAFGLEAAGGVVRWLYEHGRGYQTSVARVPIVPAAVLFDLAIGAVDWPDAALGYAACEAATGEPVAEGSVGAGTGATVGKILGMAAATKTGIGSAAIHLPGGVIVAALVATNAFGDVRRADSGTTIAGPRGENGAFRDTVATMSAMLEAAPPSLNTTLAVVATNATLDKAGCRKLAQMAQDGMARTIRPIHTPFDGDTVFAAATNALPGPPLALLGSLAADVLAAAVERSVLTATGLGGIPAASEM